MTPSRRSRERRSASTAAPELATSDGHRVAAAGDSAHLLLRRAELRRAHPDGGEALRQGAGSAGQAGRRLPCAERAHRPPCPDHPSAGSDRAGGVRGRARVRGRPDGEAPHPGRRARLPPRLHHRERRERAFLAGGGRDAVARKERRHVQADGSLDRDRIRPRRGADPRADQRPPGHRVSYRRDDLRCRRLPRRNHPVHHPAPRDVLWMGTEGHADPIRAGIRSTSKSPGSER